VTGAGYSRDASENGGTLGGGRRRPGNVSAEYEGGGVCVWSQFIIGGVAAENDRPCIR